jgi:transcriptional regulator with XRE-family HTH domain
MARIRNRVPFNNFGIDTKKARLALGYTQKELAEEVGIDTRYLSNIENYGSLPILPVFYEIITRCKLPVERYFYPKTTKVQESPERARANYKLHRCKEKYLPIIEGTLDAINKLNETENE